ncbi:MAG: hypothetical protein IKL48_02500 [Elusimicrobiaceae bacterium]|nr:hypothetical protein [Elusimicrobiaceae bacterium]
MRYILYLLTLGLVFTGGMLVGNRYVPTTSSSLSSVVAVPDLDRTNPAIDESTLFRAQENLQELTQALSTCPAVVEEEKELLFNQISLFLTLQDFELKRYIYEAEIAKNVRGTQITPQFSKAASDYATAKATTENLANTLFPIITEAEEPVSSAEQSTASTQTATAEIIPSIAENKNK